MLRDEVKLFEELSGESADNVSIERIGSFLDGYNVGKESTVKHAHWILHDDNNDIWDCSNCKTHIFINVLYGNKAKYCPNCGAKMDALK